MTSNDPQQPSSAQAGAGARSADVARSALDDKGNCLPVGTRLGEFEIVGLIGEGGFGIVYEAIDHQLQRSVAIKEYMPSAMATRSQGSVVIVKAGRHAETFEAGLRSFVNEARLLAQFDHPSLVKVFRFWEANGTAYMAMPLYRGETLRGALRSFAGAPDEAWLRRLLAPLLDALETLHEAHCYHRDIAPDNILLLGNGRPVLLDFGAARRVIGDMTQALTVILKPGYAPMEQYANGPEMPQGPWTDIYALAAVVYYCITGKAPAPSVARLMRDTMVPAQQAGRGRYGDDFLRAIDHALAVTIENRTASIAQLRSELGIDGEAASQLTTALRVPPSRAGTTTQGDATAAWPRDEAADATAHPQRDDSPHAVGERRAQSAPASASRDGVPTVPGTFSEPTQPASSEDEAATQYACGPEHAATARLSSAREPPQPPDAEPTVLVHAVPSGARTAQVQIRSDAPTRLLRAPDPRRKRRVPVVAASALAVIVAAGIGGWIAMRGADVNRGAVHAPSKAEAGREAEVASASNPQQSQPEQRESTAVTSSSPMPAQAPASKAGSAVATKTEPPPATKIEAAPAKAEAAAPKLALSSPKAEPPISKSEPAPTRAESPTPSTPESPTPSTPESPPTPEPASTPGTGLPATAQAEAPKHAEASALSKSQPASPPAGEASATPKAEPAPQNTEPAAETRTASRPARASEPSQPAGSSRAAEPASASESGSQRLTAPSASPRAPALALAPPSIERPAVERAQPFSPALALDEVYDARETDWKIDVRVDRPSIRIEKDRFGFRVRSSRSGYLYLLMLGTDGRHLYLLFPNALDDDNRVRANAELRLPRASWAIVASGPPGTNRMLAIVSAVRRDFGPAGLAGSGSIGEFDLRSVERAFSEHGALALAGRPDGCGSTDAECARYGAAHFEIHEVR